MSKTKASVSPKASAPNKASASPNKEAAAVLIVMGYDQQHKPCAARFTGADPDLVAKAAKLMDLEVREALSEDLAEVAKKLPVGRLYGNGRAFVPNVRQELYSQGRGCSIGGTPDRSSPRPRGHAGGQRPAPDLGGDRVWPSGDRPGNPGFGLVGGHRDRP